MNKRILVLLSCILFACSVFFSACSYHKKELEYPSDTTTPCDTTAVTYTKTIVPIFTSNCFRCHGGAATDGNGIKLDQYNTAKAHALFGAMLQAVNHDPGFVAMPKDGGKLSDCNIAQIRIWIANGAPN